MLRHGSRVFCYLLTLDGAYPMGEATRAMKRSLLPTAAAALALSLLAGCEQKTETVDARAPDPMASQLANAAPVELPPAVKATSTFRCKDNTLVYVDFFAGDKLANLRKEKGGTAVSLKAEKAGDPLKADGYSLTGDAKSITLTQPGKPAQSCKA